jgi:2-dehydro-3-deoxygluconokinase
MKKIVTLGEIMLRLSSPEGERLSLANRLIVHYGGAEANVAVALAHFGFESFFISKVPINPLGKAVERHLRSNGVSTDFLLKGGERLGSYYLEVGVGERSGEVNYDRKYSSFSKMKQDEVDLDAALLGASLFHVSGITLALSPELRELTLHALKKAKDYGVKTSFDFNYRATLWSQGEAKKAILPLLPFIDVCFCGELDAIYLLGMEKANDSLGSEERLKYYYSELTCMYPNIEYICSTFRTVISASSNKLQGNLFVNGTLYQSPVHSIDPIVERIGGGDAFAAGILAGILDGLEPERNISFATAASALKHTIHGDCSLFSKDEVFLFAENGSGKIVR